MATPLRGEPSIPNLIGARFAVLPAVSFDNQARIEAQEVRDIGADGNLTPELHVGELAIAQYAPRHSFSIGHVPPERATLISIAYQSVIPEERPSRSIRDLAACKIRVFGKIPDKR